MKLIRNNTPIPIGRSSKNQILCMSVNLEWKEDRQQWYVSIKDYAQIARENPQPGEPLFSFIPIHQDDGQQYEVKIRTQQQVNDLFNQFNITIAPGDNFTDKFRHLIALSAIYENQVNPPYTVNPADLEIIDTETLIAQ